jgi:hypothetical protein
MHEPAPRRAQPLLVLAFLARLLVAISLLGGGSAGAIRDTGQTGQNPPKHDKPTDDVFVAESPQEAGCTFHADGPIKLKVKVDRVVGEVDGEGYLKYPFTLVDRGIVSPTATLTLMAWDVDQADWECGCWQEVDRVLVNGYRSAA